MKTKRLEKTALYMKQAGLKQLIVSDDINLLYLTGTKFMAMERVGVLLLNDDGSAHIFANTILGLQKGDLPLTLHCDMDDPYGDLAAALLPGNVGVDINWPSGHLLHLMEKRSDVCFVPGYAPIQRARLIKSAEEITLLRESSAMNDRAIAFAVAQLAENPQLSEAELADSIEAYFISSGAEKNTWGQIVSFGMNAAFPHHAPDKTTTLRLGDAALFDLCSPRNGYWCDMTRTVFYGMPSQKHREIYETVRKAQQTAVDMVRPGISIKAIYDTCLQVIHNAGYEYDGRIGHGLGLFMHEYPDISPKDNIVLEPGMVFTLEPGIYLPGDIGVRIEDTVLVTENGHECLNHYTKELQIID